MKAVINARIYTGVEEISNGFVLYDQKVEKVASMTEWNETLSSEVIDAAGKVLIPGMIDVHIHGGYDVDVMDANPETLVKLGEELLKEGVTSYFPTTMTQHPDAIHKALEAANVAQKQTASIVGIHLEGPFVSKPRAGAQPKEYIVPPNTEQFKKWF
ncbi:MAG: amidohydrolase family protein, partial [Bacilli bacterium]